MLTFQIIGFVGVALFLASLVSGTRPAPVR
jgi:hypothetical protein